MGQPVNHRKYMYLIRINIFMVIIARSEFSFKVSQPHLRIKKRKWRELDRQIIHPHVYISSRYPISNNGEYTSTFYVRTHMLVRVALTFQPQLFDCDRRWKTGSFKDREGGFKITLIMKKTFPLSLSGFLQLRTRPFSRLGFGFMVRIGSTGHQTFTSLFSVRGLPCFIRLFLVFQRWQLSSGSNSSSTNSSSSSGSSSGSSNSSSNSGSSSSSSGKL